jgi:lysophospholipase L1-like esterase
MITSLATGASFPAPATVTFDATASDPDGTIARVEWYRGTSHLETDLAPPYSLTWSNNTPDSYTFTAKAFDNTGAATISNAVTIQVTGSSPTVIKIMPMGDSITYGTLGTGGTIGGYRPTLWRLLEAAGFRIDFLGSNQSGYPFVSDPDNEGRPGWTTGAALILAQEFLLSTFNPDIVLLMLGTNDLLLDLPGAPERLGAIMDEIARQRPNAITIVAGIIPIRDMEAQVIAYNQAVVGQVIQRQAAGQRIRYFDMNPIVSVSELPDGVHPTDGAYTNMGNAWYQALVPVLFGPP